MGGVFGVLRAFAQNYFMFVMFEFLDTLFSSGVVSVAFVICMEFLQPQHRTFGGATFIAPYPIGAMIIAWLANYFKNWRHLLLSLYIPTLLGVSYFWIIPESPRWLLSKSRMKELSQIVHTAAKMNKVQLSQETLKMLEAVPESNKEETNEKTESLLSIFKYKRMFFLVVNCSFCILTNTLVYFGLSLNSVTLAGNKYLNFAFSSLIELPAHLISWLILLKAGRRHSVSITLILAGLSCIGTEFLPIGMMIFIC